MSPVTASPPPPGTPALTIDQGRATIVLQRPRHMNRLHGEDLLCLQRQFEQIEADPSVRALVLTGHGGIFCGGFHLGELAAGTDDDPTGTRLFAQTVDALERLPLPTICRLNGSVYGGAADLALACDFRVGVDSMELRVPAARLGLHYYPSGLQRYVSRLGLAAAKRLFLLTETMAAAALHDIGYLDQVATAEALDGVVDTLVAALAANAPLAVRGMKQSLDEMAGHRADADVIARRELLCARSEDLQEGLRSFAEKRPARFMAR